MPESNCGQVTVADSMVVLSPRQPAHILLASPRRQQHQQATDSHEASVLTAAQAGDVQLLQQLTQADPAAVNQRYELGTTPLHAAAAAGHQHAVAHLLACGATANAADADGARPLHLAVLSGHEQVAQQLLGAHADVNAAISAGSTALHFAAGHGHAAIVQLLLQAGASVHANDESGYRPLHIAAAAGHTQVVAQLLAAGASASVPDALGLSPLLKAAAAGHVPVVRLILQQQPLPPGELQLAVCFADILGDMPVLAQLLFQLTRQDRQAAAAVLTQVAQGSRASQQLRTVLLQAWSADTAGVTAQAQALAAQQQAQAGVRAGLQHLAVGGLAQQEGC